MTRKKRNIEEEDEAFNVDKEVDAIVEDYERDAGRIKKCEGKNPDGFEDVPDELEEALSAGKPKKAQRKTKIDALEAVKFDETDQFMIDINEITIPEKLLRIVPDVEIAELAESIKRDGLLQPIIVSQDGELIAGYRRLLAHKSIHADRIRAVIINRPSHDRYRTSLVENLLRKQLSHGEEAHAYETLLEDKKRFPSQRALAKAIGVSEGKVSDALKSIGKTKPQSMAVREKRAVKKAAEKTYRMEEVDITPGVTAKVSRGEISVTLKIKIRDALHAKNFDIKKEIMEVMEPISPKVFAETMNICRDNL